MNLQATRVWFASVLVLLVAGMSLAETPQVDDAMYLDPEYQEVPIVPRYDPGLKTAWLKALQRPEAELKRQAADTIVIAKQRGMKDLEDTSDVLVAVLKASNGEQSVQRAIAHALVELDARDTAELLFEQSQTNGIGLALVIEPTLGRWGHQPTLEVWRKRLQEPDTPRAKLVLAINGLGAATDQGASEGLQELVADQLAQSSIRLSAARALAQIQDDGLVALSRQLVTAHDPSTLLNQLLAASLLVRHDDSEAIAVLQELAVEIQPVVVAKAMGRLLEIDPKLVFDLAPQAIQSPDAQVRYIGANGLFEKADTDAVRLLAPLVDDHNPGLRRSVASWLFELAARDELHETVVAEMTKQLAGDEWRALEQACLVLGALGHKAAAERLLELLASESDEVAISSAWALRRLKIPETLPRMLIRAKLVKDMFDGTVPHSEFPEPEGLSGQLSQLLQAFGEMRYMEADALLKSLVPKKFIYGGEEQLTADPRAAAIWSLGYLYEGQAPEALSKQIVARLTDEDILVPEWVNVRRQAGVTLGRMQSKAFLGELRAMAGGSYIGQACHWAIQRITGEPIPPVLPQEVDQVNWFVVPRATE